MKSSRNEREDHAIHDPIAAEIEPFVARLRAAGYAKGTISTKRAALRGFIVWRHRRRPPGREPDESEVSEFLERACHLDSRHRCLASTALTAFLVHLRERHLIASPARTPGALPAPAIVRHYAEHLRDERGLAERSLLVYVPPVYDLLAHLEERHGTASVRRLDASLLRAFLFARARDRSSERVRLLATALRSFSRFLHARGHVALDLSAAIPTVRKWARPAIPKKLTPEEVERVLAAPDRTTGTGRRDHAILMLLAALGLRAGEVITLELDDIRWRTGEILIRGKGKRSDLLPLPRDVGAAIARYLRLDRSRGCARRVFLRANAPRVPLTGPASVGHIVRRAMARAGIERPMGIAAHLFRHTLASRMLQRGADLRDIAKALRHRALATTEIYAKVDLDSLREVVRPWPAKGGAR